MSSPGSRLPGMRWWHKWIGIGIGVVLLAWVVSGIAMLAPLSSAVWGTDLVEASLDLRAVAVTPAEAAAAALPVAGDSGRATSVRTIAVRPLLGAAVYVVTLSRGQPTLIDAATGERFVITADRAAAIAAAEAPGGTPTGVERITKAPLGYNGRVPAYRVTFGDAAKTVAIVAEATGELTRSQGRDRFLMQLGHDVHVFAPLKYLPGGNGTRKMALVVTGVVALLSIFSGYWLSLPRWIRSRRRPSA